MSELQDSWYVARSDGSARGPYSRFQLLGMRQAGEIGDEHLVWTLALAEWIPAKRALGGGNAAAAAALQAYGTPDQKPPAPVSATQQRAADKAAKSSAKANATPGPKPTQKPPQTRKAEAQRVASPSPLLQPSAQAAVQALLKQAAPGDLALRQARVGEGIRRLLARAIDLQLLGGIGWALLSLIGVRTGAWLLLGPQSELAASPLLAAGVLVLVALALEVLLLGLFGSTPGKLLLGLSVRTSSGQAMGLPVAFTRTLAVLVRGQALLIPPFSLFAAAIALAALVKDGQTSWDKQADLRVLCAPISSNRWTAGLVVLALAWVALFEGLWMRLLYQLIS